MRWRAALLLVFVFLSCDPTKMNGKEDPQVLSVVLQTEKTVYECGEPIEVKATVSSQLATARLYHWYTNGKFEPALVSDRYTSVPSFVAEEPYSLEISVKVRVGIYVAVGSVSVTINPPPEPDYDFYVNGYPAQTQLLLYGETLEASVVFFDENPYRYCSFYWDSTRLNGEPGNEFKMTVTESHFGTHRFSVRVFDGNIESERACTVKVGPVIGAVSTDEAGLIRVLYGEDLSVGARFRSAGDKYRLLSVSWSIGLPQAQPAALTPLDASYISENGLKLNLPGSTKWMRPDDASAGKRYQLRVEFCFTDDGQAGIQTLSDSVIVEIAPYEPLRIEKLTVPEKISFYEFRNGLVSVSASAVGGRQPLKYSWSLDGNSSGSVSLPQWTLPRPVEAAGNPQECTVGLVVSDGLTEVGQSAQITVTPSDAPLIFRYYAGECVLFDPVTTSPSEVFFIVSRAEAAGSVSQRQSVAVTDDLPASGIARGSEVLLSGKTFTVSGQSVPAVLRHSVADSATGIHLEIWVAENCWIGGNSASVTESDLKKIGEAFLPASGNGIYRQTTALLGDAWGNLPSVLYAKYIDSRKTFSILLCDIDEDRKTDFTSGAVAGIFEPKNCFRKVYEPSSDEKLMIAIDALLYRFDADTVLSTAAHEFAHQISFYQKELSQFSGKKAMDRWLNEVISMCVEDLLSENRGWMGPRGISGISVPDYPPYLTTGRLPNFISDLTLSLIPDRYDLPSVYENYATGYAFGAYLIRNYSHPDLLKKILKNTDDGFDAVLTGLRNCGFTVSREDLFADYGTAIVLSEMKNLPTVSRKRYNAGENGFVYSDQFLLGSVNLNAYRKGTQEGPFFSANLPEIKAPPKNYSHVIYRMTKNSGFSPVSGTVPAGCVVTLVQK